MGRCDWRCLHPAATTNKGRRHATISQEIYRGETAVLINGLVLGCDVVFDWKRKMIETIFCYVFWCPHPSSPFKQVQIQKPKSTTTNNNLIHFKLNKPNIQFSTDNRFISLQKLTSQQNNQSTWNLSEIWLQLAWNSQISDKFQILKIPSRFSTSLDSSKSWSEIHLEFEWWIPGEFQLFVIYRHFSVISWNSAGI